jgi:2-isopropylmalate synthase
LNKHKIYNLSKQVMKMEKIRIFDTTLRDGEQSPGAALTVQEKLEVAKQLEKLGVDVIEAGFAISSEGDFEAIKLIAEKIKGISICSLARAKKEDIDRAWQALKDAEKPRIHIFLATSPIHMKEKLRKTKEQVLQMIRESVKYASSFFKEIEFTPEDSARTEPDFMIEAVRTAIDSGATIINIADTVGYAQPEEFGKIIKNVLDKLGSLIKEKNITISAHCHNDLGLAVANSLEAVKQGATQIECTINGIGERAGNCALEEVVMNLKTRKDIFKNFHTTINTKELFRTSQLVSSLTGLSISKNKAIIGENAFSHEAGIHQHGILRHRETYEIMNSEDIGWQGKTIVLGKHSGRHAVKCVLKTTNYNLTDSQIDKLMKKIKDLSDKEKNLDQEKVIHLIKELSEEH